MHVKYWSENLRGRDHIRVPSMDWRIILIWILNNLWTTFRWLGLDAEMV